MDRSIAALAALTLTITLFIPQVSAIKCYECNSHNDSRCAQEKPPEQLKKDCTTHQNEKNNYVLCRKIVQTIEYEVNGLKPDTRIIRSCGWDNTSYVNTCYHRSGFGGRQEVCTCSSDFCNSAPTTFAPITLLILMTFKIFIL